MLYVLNFKFKAMETKNNQTTKYQRFPLAKAGRRIAAKLIDIILVGLIVTGLGLAIFLTDPGYKANKIISQTWRYGLFSFLACLIFTGLMLILPNFWKKTLGMRVLNLGYINILPLSKFIGNLFKHELLIWELICMMCLVTGIVLTASSADNAKMLLDGIMLNNVSNKSVYYYVGTGFSAVYTACALMLVGVIIGVCARNKKPAFHDKFSNVYVAHLVSTNDPNKLENIKKRNNKKINFGVPGEISDSAFEEIDKL